MDRIEEQSLRFVEVPRVRVKRTGNGLGLRGFCPYCREWHVWQARTNEYGGDNQFRMALCAFPRSPLLRTGVFLVETINEMALVDEDLVLLPWEEPVAGETREGNNNGRG